MKNEKIYLEKARKSICLDKESSLLTIAAQKFKAKQGDFVSNLFALIASSESMSFEQIYKKIKSISNFESRECFPLIPGEFINEDVAIYLCGLDHEYIKHLPERLKTEKFFKKLLEASEYGHELEYIPDSLVSDRLLNKVVSKYGRVLEFVSPKRRSIGLCLLAIKSNPDALEFVPNNLIDKDLIHSILKHHPETIKLVPEKFLTQELVIDCAKRYEGSSFLKKYILHNGGVKSVFWLPKKFMSNSELLKEIILADPINLIDLSRTQINRVFNDVEELKKIVQEYPYQSNLLEHVFG